MTSLLRWSAFAAIVFAALSAKAADTAALAKRLHNAADATSLDDPTLKPWHLKLNVQLYDAKGSPSEQGTVEEWWTPDADKRTYEFPSYTATELRNKEKLYRTTDQPIAPYLVDAIRERAVHPMATTQEIDGSQPEMRVESFGGVKLDCIMLDQPIKNVAYPPMGLFPTYCLEQGKDMLRLAYRFGSETATLNTMGIFQGRRVGLDATISTSNVKAVSAHVATLEGKIFEPSFFAPAPDLQERNATLTKIGAAIMAGMILRKINPIYPQSAKERHITGTVHLNAVIGTDGHIHQLRIIDTPDPSLAISALAAVRQWIYKPYLLNGVPTEVDTIITVNYEMG